VNGARLYNEPGIFVAFEEDSQQIIANASKFGWDLHELQRKKLFFLDAQPKPDLVQSGSFDLSGMLAALTARVKQLGAKRIVFDSVDRLLELLDNPKEERREVYRLHEWLIDQKLTAIITAKAYGEKAGVPDQQQYGFMQFMVNCAVALNHEMVQGVSQRNLRVIKYRGSAFDESESPLVFGEHGLEIAGSLMLPAKAAKVTTERISTGVARLDTMLEGGYFRGASVLITGSPGTSKTTLAGAFAQAACLRGEHTLFVSFDSNPAEIVRDLASVKIRLAPLEKRGLLRLASARTGMSSTERRFMLIKKLAHEHRARCLVIDPVSALSKQGNELTSHGVLERLTDWVKAEGITLLCTSLLDNAKPEMEGTKLQISTIADTWIHLSYLAKAGERNRALTIIKSRGTAHSNQVRELMLSRRGITLTDVYMEGGEVLMGTMRWEKEQAARAEKLVQQTEIRRRSQELENSEAELKERLQALERELGAKQAERMVLNHANGENRGVLANGRSELRGMRGADANVRATKQSNHAHRPSSKNGTSAVP
jgi:circadian clock protein KaiC